MGFLHVRNEIRRIGEVLDHHRRLGIAEFFIVDNGSTDGTIQYLEQQHDVNLFISGLGFSESRFGMVVINHLLDLYGNGRWCLMVDADEHFVYPDCERKDLNVLTRYLDRLNFGAMFTVMVDMYGDKPIRDTSFVQGQRLLDLCSHFDTKPYVVLKDQRFPYLNVRGGPRMRVFWTRDDDHPPPTISKVPLVKWSSGMRFVSVAHFMNPAPKRLADVTGALLHYKYFSDFHERALAEVARKEHYQGAREYQKYLAGIESNPGMTLRYEGSRRYASADDLIAARLIRTSAQWRSFA